jgi:hypothetical protein
MRNAALSTILLVISSLAGFAQAPASQTETADIAKLQHEVERDRKLLADWANLARYHEDNAKLAPPAAHEDRVVFMGDSITDAWGRTYGHFFPEKRRQSRHQRADHTADADPFPARCHCAAA